MVKVLGHLKGLEHAVLIAITGGLLLILGLLGALSRQFVRGEGLELDGIGAALRGGFDQRQRQFLVAVMIDAGFGDDEGFHGALP